MKALTKHILNPFKDLLGIGYGYCRCCGFHWNMVKPYHLRITEWTGCFATCCDCWENKNDSEIIMAFDRQYDSWLAGDSHNPPLTVEQIGFTREQMLHALKEELRKRKHNNGREDKALVGRPSD